MPRVTFEDKINVKPLGPVHKTELRAEDVNELKRCINGNELEILNKVSKEVGKGLSSQDYTINDKKKVQTSLQPTNIANNLTTTQEGKVLDARQGKVLDEKKIDKIQPTANNKRIFVINEDGTVSLAPRMGMVESINFVDTGDADTKPDTIRLTMVGGATMDANINELFDIGAFSSAELGSDYTINYKTLGNTTVPLSLKPFFDDINVRVGGRNYFIFSEKIKHLTDIKITAPSGRKYYAQGYSWYNRFDFENFEINTEYVISIPVFNNSSTPVNFRIQLVSDDGEEKLIYNLSPNEERLIEHVYTPTNGTFRVYFLKGTDSANDGVDYVYCGFPKIEKGTTPTDWTPAPEDYWREIRTTVLKTSQNINTSDRIDNLSQNGRTIVTQGPSNLVITIDSDDGFVSSYQKCGTGDVTFQAGSGKTLVQVDGTNVISGLEGSTATVTVVGSKVYLRISNAV